MPDVKCRPDSPKSSFRTSTCRPPHCVCSSVCYQASILSPSVPGTAIQLTQVVQTCLCASGIRHAVLGIRLLDALPRRPCHACRPDLASGAENPSPSQCDALTQDHRASRPACSKHTLIRQLPGSLRTVWLAGPDRHRAGAKLRGRPPLLPTTLARSLPTRGPTPPILAVLGCLSPHSNRTLRSTSPAQPRIDHARVSIRTSGRFLVP